MKKTLVLLLMVLASPISVGAADSEKEVESNEVEIPDKPISLEEDRKALEKFREEIPEDIKVQNDDLGYLLRLFDDKNRKPERIRSEFSSKINRLRQRRNKEFKKTRNTFSKNEKKETKSFLKAMKKERDEFLKKKPKKEESREFFDEQSAKRREFFADQKERRRDFETQIRGQQQDLNSYLRDKRKEFNDLYRDYSREYRNRKREQKKAAKQLLKKNTAQANPDRPGLSAQDKALIEDFKKIPKGPGILLKAGEDDGA